MRCACVCRQDARYGWNDKRILAPPEHPYFSLEAFTSHLVSAVHS